MRIVTSILLFYKKLITPTLAVSILLGFIGAGVTGDFSLKPIGVSYIFIGLLFHYIIYEIRNPNEYYFYFNIGLSKNLLWICTLIINLIIGLILIMI